MKQEVLDKLFAAMQGAKGVPALEDTVAGILTSLRDVQGGKHNLAAQISEDFAMTQKVLKLANSAMYAPFADGISSVSAALDVLGADALLHLVLGASMITASELKDDEELSQTLLASELARTVSTERSEDVSIATLMFDLGKLMATRFLPAEVAAVNRKVGAGGTADEAAQAVLGMSYAQLGVEVAKRWKLPSEIVSIIDGTGDPALVGIAKFSTQASSMIHAGEAEAVNNLMQALDVPGVDKSKLGSLIERKLVDIAPTAKPAVASDPQSLLNALHASLLREKRTSVEGLANAMFPELALALDTAHCLLFMMIKSGDFLIRCGHGKGVNEFRTRLRLSAEFKPTAFHAAIKNNVDVVIADVAKLNAAGLPEGYRELMPTVASFIILPIGTGRVTGMLYLDWEKPQHLEQATIIALRELRDLFLPFFPR